MNICRVPITLDPEYLDDLQSSFWQETWEAHSFVGFKQILDDGGSNEDTVNVAVLLNAA